MSTARGRAQRETSAGGIVYRLAESPNGGPREPLFLLIRDSYKNWGFPKGHLERGEMPEAAALREVAEETGLTGLALRGPIETIDWYFRFRGRLVHKICYFYLMETDQAETSPQREEAFERCPSRIIKRHQPFSAAFALDQQNPFIARCSTHRARQERVWFAGR